MKNFKTTLNELWLFTIIPVLYSFALWLTASAAAVLFLGDLWRGMGVASALGIYQITRIRYSQDMQRAYEGQLLHDQSDEA